MSEVTARVSVRQKPWHDVRLDWSLVDVGEAEIAGHKIAEPASVADDNRIAELIGRM